MFLKSQLIHVHMANHPLEMITTPGKKTGMDGGNEAVSTKTLFWPKVLISRSRRSTLPYSNSEILFSTGYKEYNMHRKTLNWMGDRHKNPDKEVKLDGIGGVSILVKAAVHRSGRSIFGLAKALCVALIARSRHQFPLLRVREPGRYRGFRGHGQSSGL